MLFNLGADGTTIVADGEIIKGDEEVLAHLLKRHRGVRLLALDSPGGSVAEAVVIGQLLREAGVSTFIPDRAACYSACFFVFAGGQNREIARGGELGVHQFYGADEGDQVSDVEGQTQRLSAMLLSYIDDMGIDPRTMFLALETAPESIYVFRPEELTAFNIVTVPPCPFPEGFEVSDPLGIYPGC